MSNFTFVTNIDQKTYDDFVSHHPLNNLLQSYNWYHVKDNWDHIHTAVYEDDQLVACGLVLIKRLPLNMSMYYLPHGPILDYQRLELLDFYFKSLKNYSKKDHCLYIKFDPLILINSFKTKDANDDIDPKASLLLDNITSIGAKHLGFSKDLNAYVQPRYISCLKLEDFESKLPKSTVRAIADAKKRNVEVYFGGLEYLDDFNHLMDLTAERQHVSLRNKEYFEKLIKTYGDDATIIMSYIDINQTYQTTLDKINDLKEELDNLPPNQKKKARRLEELITYAKKELDDYEQIKKDYSTDKIAIAGILNINYGDTGEILYAGMDQNFKKLMPQYQAYVETFKRSYSNNITRVSMGGVDGSLNDGLTRFKDKFNPDIEVYIGEFDYPINKFLYKISQIFYKR